MTIKISFIKPNYSVRVKLSLPTAKPWNELEWGKRKVKQNLLPDITTTVFKRPFQVNY